MQFYFFQCDYFPWVLLKMEGLFSGTKRMKKTSPKKMHCDLFLNSSIAACQKVTVTWNLAGRKQLSPKSLYPLQISLEEEEGSLSQLLIQSPFHIIFFQTCQLQSLYLFLNINCWKRKLSLPAWEAKLQPVFSEQAYQGHRGQAAASRLCCSRNKILKIRLALLL